MKLRETQQFDGDEYGMMEQLFPKSKKRSKFSSMMGESIDEKAGLKPAEPV